MADEASLDQFRATFEFASTRAKPVRATTTGSVRPRTCDSPPALSAGPSTLESQNDGRPPAKRARKAINCEPCRNSKLKCDRNRPCSSCVLRGTSSLCYQDSRGPGSTEAQNRGPINSRIDPAQEFARVRRSLALLETFVLKTDPSASGTNTNGEYFTPALGQDPLVLTKDEFESGPDDQGTTLGSLGRQSEGLYTGPTSAASHFVSTDGREGGDDSDRQSSEDELQSEYDRDLIARLPNVSVIDSLVDFYFEYANWVYRHVNQAAFTKAWRKYKDGHSTDRITLATVCAIMAVATFYLPDRHALQPTLLQRDSDEQQGDQYYDVMREVLARHVAENHKYTLELVELNLIQSHYLTLAKRNGEEIWALRGELVSMATAMGLHRDPGKWRIPREVAERRRWAWWYIILLERWQAFLFGRPPAIASHHFDTQLPSYCDPSIDATGRLYLPNIALFRLAYLLGDILDDAVSLRPVSYQTMLARDKDLTSWMDALPQELNLDEYRVARSLASPVPEVRRLGVQSVIVRIAYYHIRFTLHRPYATMCTSPASGRRSTHDTKELAHSLDIAVSAADKVISMVCQARPDFLSNASLAVPGHMNWGSLHIFSAAMFFSFQLIANPDQPGANLFRENITKTMTVLRQTHGSAPVADKAYNILQAIAPLYSEEFRNTPSEEREKKKQSVLSRVKTLAFPYHGSGVRTGSNTGTSGSSPMTRNVTSPTDSTVQSPSSNAGFGLPGSPEPRAVTMQHGLSISSIRESASTAASDTLYSASPSSASPMPPPHSNRGMASQQGFATSAPTVNAPVPHGGYTLASQPQRHPPQLNVYPRNSSAAPLQAESSMHYPPLPMAPSVGSHQVQPGPIDGMMWGASMGFEHGEWVQFLDAMEAPGRVA